MTSLRCSQCGEESPQTAAFCFACGKPIVSTPQFELNPESTATSNNRLKYISGGIVVVLFLAFLFVYHEGKVKVDPKSQPATNVPNSSIENPAANVPKPKQSLLNSLLKLPVKNTIVVGPLTMTFGKFSQAKEFEFERYPGESHARTAIRGKKYITANVDIGSKDKNPSLPCLFLFKYSNGALEYQDTFYYQFYRWEDFATYLGNYHDNGNDFYFTEKIKFSVGISVDEEILRNNAILVLLKRENTISRSEERFGNPPVKYSEDGCLTPDNYSLDANWLDHYEVVTITNKEKLK